MLIRQRRVAGGATQYTIWTLNDLAKASAARAGIRGFTGGLHFGYDCKLRDMAATLGFLLGGGFGTGTARLSYPAYFRTHDGITNPAGGIGIRLSKLTHGGFFDAAGRVGCVIGRSLPFFKFGWGIHNYTLHHPDFKAKSKWFNCLMVGIGVDVTVKKNVLIGVVSDVDLCQKQGFKLNNVIDPRGALKCRPTNFRTLATIKYKFLTDKR